MTFEQLGQDLFKKIAHGDSLHRSWLEHEIREFMNECDNEYGIIDPYDFIEKENEGTD